MQVWQGMENQIEKQMEDEVETGRFTRDVRLEINLLVGRRERNGS